MLPYGHPLEAEFIAADHRLNSAIRERSWRDRCSRPDDRLDDLGWEIFLCAVDLGTDPDEAGKLAMDGTLRQRERIFRDVIDRNTRRWTRTVRELMPPGEFPADGDEQLVWWLERDPSTSFVYFVQSGGGAVKIGTARDPKQRLRELQTGNPEPLELRQVVPGGRKEESALHRRFEQARLRGEWFGADYLPLVVVFGAALAEEAMRAYDGSAPRIAIGGAAIRSQQEILRIRRDIEDQWLRGESIEAIAGLLSLDVDEVREQLAQMRRSTLYDLKRPAMCRGTRLATRRYA